VAADPHRRTEVDTRDLGRWGEDLAARHLESRGWTVLARNLREGRREVDLVVRRGKVVAFVEVKCRRGTGFGHPLEAITHLKREEIARVARAWLRTQALPPGVILRFDAVSVVLRGGEPPELVHVPDAWRLG
jgi:putative endonuclease